MSFIVRNITGSPAVDVLLNDLGLTIPAGTDFDMTGEQPQDVALSADLIAQIDADNLIVLDPLDGTTPLTKEQSKELVEVHNDPHYRIRGGELDQLDDVDTTGAVSGIVYLLTRTEQGSPVQDVWTPVTPADVLGGNARLGDLQDVNTPSPTGSPLGQWEDGEVYVLVGNASNEVNAVPLFGGSPSTPIPGFCEGVQDIIGDMVTGGAQTDITVTYTDGAGACDGVINFSVDDVFLRNTGDVLESGTLEIAPGATIIIKGPAGSPVQEGSLVIEMGATATIETPTGNFTNDNDIVNKKYVDSIAQGIDWKESVRGATSGDLLSGSPAAVYNIGGSPATPDTITGVDLTSDALFDGVPSAVGGLVVGDRILVKDETDPKRNGIYVVTATGASGTLERAPDQDGNPGAEVSAGNTVFVENGTDHAKTVWSVVGDGVLTLNTDDINWSQTGAATDVLAGIGLSESGQVIDLDVDDLTSATVALTDSIAFHDVSGTAAASGSQTRKTTIQDFLEDLDVVYNVTGTGFISRTGGSPDTYSTLTLTAGTGDRAGIEILNGDGSGGNPVIGLDIENLPPVSGSPLIDTSDRVPVYDVDTDTNVYYTIGQIATALGASNSFETWSGAGNTSGSASISADSPTDTVTITGGTGINVDLVAGTDTVTWSLDFNTLPPATTGSPGDTPDGDTEIIVNIGGTIYVTTINDILGNVLVASTDEDLLGASVVTSGSPAVTEVGVDIVGQTDPDDDMEATDEFLVHDKSEGTAGANRKMTGKNIADGVVNILGLEDISVEVIGGTGSPGERTLFILDPTTNEKLSIAEVTMTFSDNIVQNNGWIEIGNAVDALTGYIIPMNAKLVRISAHTSSKGAAAKDIDLYKNGTLFVDPLFTFAAGAGEASHFDATVDYDFDAGDKVRLRGGPTGGGIQDTVVTLWFRWRTA